MSGERNLLKTLKSRAEIKNPIATDMFLPNNSGDHTKSIKTNTPLNDTDLVNKAYCDANMPDLSNYADISGTPAQYQVALWTDANTIKGDSELTYDGTTLFLNTTGATKDTARPCHIASGSVTRFDRYSGNNSGSGVLAHKARGTGSSPSAVQTDDYIAVLQGRGYVSGGSWSSVGILGIRVETPNGTTLPGYIVFELTDSTGTNVERVRVTSAGRMGIGTTTPNELLEVNGKIRSNTGFNINGTDGASGSFTTVDGKTVTVTNGIITSIV